MNVLHAGRLAKSKEDFKIVQLGPEYIDQVVQMQEQVRRNMRHKSWFMLDTGEEIEAMLKGGGALFGALNQHGEMIAARYISQPGDSASNLANDVALDIPLNEVAVLESTVVSPDYRGNRLQGIMTQVAIKHIERQGLRHLFCTVAPQNIFSLYNVMSSGLKIRALKKKYGTTEHDGVWRFILHRDLLDSQPAWLKQLEIDSHDFDLQKLVINKGFFGDSVSRKTNTIVYAR